MFFFFIFQQGADPGEYRPRLLFTAQALAGGSSMRCEKQACGMRSSPPAAGLKTLSRARRRRTAAGALASADG